MSFAFRLSLLANLALLGTTSALLWRAHRPETPVRPPGGPPAATRLFATSVRPGPKTDGLTPAAVARLEQMGIPRGTLIDVLLADFGRRSTEQMAALQKRYAPKPVPKRDLIEFARQFDADRIRELKETFGEEGYRAWDKEQTLQELNTARAPGDPLPMTADEAEQAYRLQKEFDQKAKDLQMAMEDGIADKADVGALQAQAQHALDQQLEQLLGTQRFNELRGNADPTVQVYRTFGDLNPTPDQAQAVLQADAAYRASEAALAQQLSANPGGGDPAAQLQALADAREQAYRQAFGQAAYDDYKLQHDPTYQTLTQYAGAWNLSGADVQQVYQSVSAYQQQASALREAAALQQQSGQNVDWGAVNAAIQQAQQQTEAALQTAIGPERLQRLEQNGLLQDGGPSG